MERFIILIALIIQGGITKLNRLAGAIIGYLITTGIFIWGLTVYAEGNYIELFSIQLSSQAFIVACLVWFGLDTFTFISALAGKRKDKTEVQSIKNSSARANCPHCGYGPITSIDQKCPKCFKDLPPIVVSAQGDSNTAAGAAGATTVKLAVPCQVVFYRESSFVGAIMPQVVYLNGHQIGNVKNGNSIKFDTNLKSNTITVADHLGVAFNDKYEFDAVEGGTVEVHFKRKFIR